MWQTDEGERVLQGHEAALVQTTIDSLLDATHIAWHQYSDPECGKTGVALFDKLEASEQLACIRLIAECLLTPLQMESPVAAVHAATIAAVFVHLRHQVEIEIDNEAYDDALPDEVDEGTFWRQLTLAAWSETNLNPFTENLIPPSEKEAADDDRGELIEEISFARWDKMIENLCDRLLEDRDFEMADQFLDAHPNVADRVKEGMGIGDDYFIAHPPLVSPDEFDDLLLSTRRLVRKPR